MAKRNVTELEKLMTNCSDPAHLHAWIQKYAGLDFPNQTISRFSNSNPFDFIWKAYSAIIEGRAVSYMGLAGRDSMKTLGLAIIDLLAILHDGRNLTHIAMTTQQASRARNYLDAFVNKQPLIRKAVIKQNTREIKLMIDGRECGLELIPATPRAVQGSHASVVSFDELASSMEPNNVRAYRDAHGILGSSDKGKPAVILKITSRQAGYSLAEQELRDAAKTGLQILKWTTLDATEKCKDERSGTTPLHLWVNAMRGETYTEEEFKAYPEAKKDGFTLTTDTFNACRECPIASFCQGDLKKQKSTSVLLRTIDDVINKIRLAGSWDWACAQIMSLAPSSEGKIFFEFDRQIHQPGWNKMWLALTGVEASHEITRDIMIRELRKRGANFYAGIDWGWSSPSTCVVMAVDRREVCYVIDILGRTYTSDPDFIEMVRQTLHRKYDIQMYMPDLANGSGNSLLRQAGLPTTDEIDKSISLGINLVKGLLRIPGTNNIPRMYFAPDLVSQIPGIPGMIEELELYHKKVDATGKILDNDDPADEYNHYIDALRYMVYWLFGRMRMKVGTDYLDNAPVSHASNVPSLDEIARQNGIKFIDNRDPNNPDDDPTDPPPSGALWSWT